MECSLLPLPQKLQAHAQRRKPAGGVVRCAGAQAVFEVGKQGTLHQRFAEMTPAGKNSDCLVRPATTADMASVTAIYAHFVETSTATFDLVAPGQATMLRRRQVVVDRGLPYLVAELEGYIVGYSYAAPFRPREGYRFTVEDSIYVRADCVGYGVGKLLLTELIAKCQHKGCHSMVACVCGINPPSVALHSSLGFVLVGTLPEAGKKFGEWLSLSIMQRLLR